MLVKRLQAEKVGLIVRGLTGIDPGQIAALAAEQLNRPLYVACVGDYTITNGHLSVTLTQSIESAVAWRNQPDLGGPILVFIQNDSRKSHSLAEFDELTARDLATHLLETAEQVLTDNEPQTQFWAALRQETANFPLSMLEDFVQAVSDQRASPAAIIDNLWRLGLLRDEAILDRGKSVSERVQRNRELIEKMGLLSEQNRRRIGSVLVRVRGEESDRLRRAFLTLKEFYFRGQIEALRQLDFATVEQLIEAGRPLPQTPPPQPAPPEPTLEEIWLADTLALDDVPADEPTQSDRPLRGKELQQTIAECAASYTPENQQGLRQLGEFLKQRLQEPQETEDEITLNAGFAGRTLQPALPRDELRQFMGYVCGSQQWGGLLQATRPGLKEAIFEATPADITPYNPDDPAQGQAGQCLFSLLRRFDPHLPEDVSFSAPLERLIAGRTGLLAHLDLLLNFPLVLFGGYPEARQILNDYLDAYADLLGLFREHEALLHRLDALATDFIAAELIRLDTVYILSERSEGEVEWRAMLTPLHPLHLWRFREIFKTVHAGHRPLTEEEQQQLGAALPTLPHLLHYLVLSPNVTGGQIILPQAGSLENLPTYENHTNRYLGDDGVELVAEFLKSWLDYAPYSQPQIRLGLVDVPNLALGLKSAAEFLKSKRHTRLVIHSYTTRRQNQAGELAQLDFDDRDHDIAELLRTKRLTIHLRQLPSVQAVIETLQAQPVHILYLFDQSQYQVEYGPRARQLWVSPLVITYEYEYNEIFKRGVIAPSSEAEDGVFAYYHFLVERAASLPAGKQIRLQYNPEAELTPINTLLLTDAARWLVIADRVLTNYSPKNAVPLGEKRDRRREIAVWSKVSDQAIKRFIDLLRRFNLRPDKGTITDLLQQFGHLATEGLVSLALIGGNPADRDTKQKGLLGKLLAARWYTNCYPGALVASLDSNLAQQWLQARSYGGERADLIGLRLVADQLIVEPIEVKTRAGSAEVRLEKDTLTGRNRLAGHAVEQLEAVIQTLEPIFGQADAQPLFTPARREVLRYQLYRECFHEAHAPEWQRDWYHRLKDAFTQPLPAIPVVCRGLIIHIRLEEGDNETISDYPDQDLTLVRLGTQAVQRLLIPTLLDEKTNEGADTRSTLTDLVSIPTGLAPIPTAPTNPAPIDSIAAPADRDQPAPPEPTPPNRPALNDHPSLPPTVSAAQTPAQAEVRDLARRFLRACQSYRIQVDSCDPDRAIAGPNVWRFYVRLSRGQRLDPLRNILEDIGREMAHSGLLVSPLPNSEEIALDIPRAAADRRIVPLAQGLARLPTATSPEELPILIGVTPEGDDIIRDLGRMPHLLVGGTTGAGKTIFLYGLLLSLMHTHPDPASLRLLLSTSKPEDFVFFNRLPYLETGQVIDEADRAVALLQSFVPQVFEERKRLLTAAHCRDIGEYNIRHTSQLSPLVIVVDEFADLADQLAGDRAGQRTFYDQLRRVAQLGRNRGIHLVLCTQRPSADLVPTNIRNLMNSRVALRVNDSTASKMILDEPGAEQLQFHGDLLFKEQAILTRAQGYYVAGSELSELLKNVQSD
jgi:hypothetical protein